MCTNKRKNMTRSMNSKIMECDKMHLFFRQNFHHNCFEENSASRWRDMMASGCRTGEEYTWAWEIIRQEATEASQYLDRELEGPLVSVVEGA